jgi:type I restriction enzyme S subunit
MVIDAGFLYYSMCGAEFQASLYGVMTHGSMVADYVSLSQQLDFTMRLPDVGTQRRIARILGALDDKIELNRRMSQTLESMARALFKSWFVDFDPVRAKAEGRDPGLASHVADLFPSSFEDSELGEIPAGWRANTVGSMADVVDCSHSKKPERLANGRPLLQLDNIRQDGVLDMAEQYFIGSGDYQAWTARIEASPGDCVITNVGRVGAVAQVPSDVWAALGRNMTAVRCGSDKPWPTFLVEALRSDSMRDEIVRKTDAGTILDALNVRSIPRLRVVEPSAPVLSRFEFAARPLRARMETIEHESRGLQRLRDAMLPSLLAGKVPARSMDRVVGAMG